MIKKAVLPIAGLGTRFLPLSKELPKEFWPLADLPVIQYIVEEARDSGIEEIIFVISPEKRMIVDYFNGSAKAEKILKQRNKSSVLLDMLTEFKDSFKDVSFSYVIQKNPLGDGHAILQAAEKIGDDSFGVLFGDDVVDYKIPCLGQLVNVYKTCQKPVIAIRRVSEEMISSYGILNVEKIANRFYKIKGIVEKPELKFAPSDFAIAGKYVATPTVLDYLRKEPKPKRGKEIILANIFEKMIEDGHSVYGYEFEGEWLECGNKLNWLKSHMYYSLKHPKLGPQLKKHLKEIL